VVPLAETGVSGSVLLKKQNRSKEIRKELASGSSER
jgi:hypothetical protein